MQRETRLRGQDRWALELVLPSYLMLVLLDLLLQVLLLLLKLAQRHHVVELGV